jgi:hypothetical protein
MRGYKGFDKDLKCRCFEFAVGETYKTDKAELCSCGFHFCENPLDVLDYYPLGLSRYCEVEAFDVSGQKESDTKRVCKKIKIVKELTAVEFVNQGLEKYNGGCLYLSGLTSAEGLALPPSIGGSLDLSGLTSAEAKEAVKKCKVGGKIYYKQEVK